MRPTAKPVNPMWDGYKIDIVPHLMDPEGKPVKLLKRIASSLAEHYQTNVSAKIEFKGADAYSYDVFLLKQRVGCERVIYNQLFEQVVEHDQFTLFLERLWIRPIDREINKHKINQRQDQFL